MANILFKIVRMCHSKLKCNYLKNEKLFLNFLLHQKMLVIANVVPKLETVKILVGKLSKNRRFRRRFESQHVKASQILAKSPSEHFDHVFSSFSKKLILEISPLVLGQILGVFVNLFTADDKYPVQDCENLHSQFKCNYMKNQKLFKIFVAFLESTSNSKHFARNVDCHS